MQHRVAFYQDFGWVSVGKHILVVLSHVCLIWEVIHTCCNVKKAIFCKAVFNWPFPLNKSALKYLCHWESSLIEFALFFLPVVSYMTTTFVIETMAAANAQLRWKRREQEEVCEWSLMQPRPFLSVLHVLFSFTCSHRHCSQLPSLAYSNRACWKL